MNKEQLGKLLVELRKRENFSQKDFAEKLGIVPSTLCKWEQGYTCPDLSYLNQITNILNVSYEELLHPEETLQKLSQSSIDDNEKQCRHLHPKLLTTCACMVIFVLLSSFGIYQYTRPQFKIIDSRYNYGNDSAIIYEMAIICKKNVGYDEWNAFEDSLHEEWIEGKYANDADIVKLYFYSDKKDGLQWAETENVTILVK